MSFGGRLRALRERSGRTQGQLARDAGVSRQLVGAVEADRHLPRVDAATRLARALGVTVEELLVDDAPHAPVGVNGTPSDGALVRVARVGERRVAAPVEAGPGGLPVADGVWRAGVVELFDPERPAAVVAGCEPAIGLTGRLAEERSWCRAVAVATSTATALDALRNGRVHAAVVHGPEPELPVPSLQVRRWRIATWRVGLAAPADRPAGWVEDALAGRVEVVQREPGARSQVALDRAVTGAGPVPGPRASGHADAARRAATTGAVAVTIEPSAIVAGLDFHPLEVHVSELWVASEHVDAPDVRRFVDVLTGAPVRARLTAIGGYDLAELGREIAA